MPTIVAVDDSVTMRKCLEITFASTEFELVTCADAAGAMAKVKELSPALVIADVSLPQRDGYTLCSEVKTAAPTLPVLLLSSKQNPFDPAKGADADGHLDKPFDTQVLQDRARALVEAAPKAVTPRPTAARPLQHTPAAAAKPAARSGSQIRIGGQPRTAARTPAQPRVTAQPRIEAQRRQQRDAGGLMDSPTRVRRSQPRMPPATGHTMPLGRPNFAASELLGRGARRPAKPLVKPDAKPPRLPLQLDEAFEPDSLPAPPPPGVASPEPAAASSEPAAASPEPAAADAAAATISPAAAKDLRGKLDDLGLTKAQIEGVLALSREVVEQVVWEVVPVLAETLIKEELRRLTQD